jgi:hypothetical protein
VLVFATDRVHRTIGAIRLAILRVTILHLTILVGAQQRSRLGRTGGFRVFSKLWLNDENDVEGDEGEQKHDAQQIHGDLGGLPVGHAETLARGGVAGGWLLMGVRVDDEGAGDEGGFEDDGKDPGCQVGFGGRGLGVQQRDEEQAVDEEGADEVDLRTG